ncbi:MAG: hypothetical protein H6855_04615 [Rhodospirillales bacterium]|nr:hypothetical protein [Rhodospirillales bacterium]
MRILQLTALGGLVAAILGAGGAYAQQQTSSALPVISAPGGAIAQKPPAQTGVYTRQEYQQQQEKGTSGGASSLVLNPLDMVRAREEKQREAAKPKSWSSKSSVQVAGEKTAEDGIKKQDKAVMSSDSVRPIKKKQAASLPPPSPSEVSSEEELSSSQKMEQKDKDTVASGEEERSAQDKVEANKGVDQSPKKKPKKSDLSEAQKKERLKAFDSAVKAIPKPDVPDRLWSVD